MRSLAVAAAVAIALTAGCGDDTDHATSGGTTATSQADGLSEAELEVMMLQLDDMPELSTVHPQSSDVDTECSLGFDARVAYNANNNAGTSVTQTLTVGGADHYDALVETYDGCTDANDGWSVETALMNGPAVGDESQGIRSTLTTPGGRTLVGYEVVFRVGELVSSVAVVDRVGGSSHLLDRYAEIAADRIQAAN